MSRGVAAATATELATKNFNIVNLLELQGIASATDIVRLTDAPTDIVHSSNTYTSTRGMLGVNDITEEDQLKIESVDINLSGVATENVKLFLDFNYIDRRVLIHRAVIDDKYTILGSPILVFDGRLDQPRVQEDFKSGTAILSVTATSHWTDFEAQEGRHTNTTEQQTLFPNDNFFDKATEIQKDVKWGRS